MSTSDVRSIESLARFHAGILKLSSDWEKVLQELRMAIQRAEQHYCHDRPRYWRNQIELAERELTEAKDNLSKKRAVDRDGKRPSAMEALQRVNKAKRRLDYSRDKAKQAKMIAIEMSQECDKILGPLADVTEHSEVVLPAAAVELKGIIEKLRLYAEQSEPNE